MDMVLYALLNKKIKSAITGIASCQVIGTNLIFNFTDGTSQTMAFPSPKDGVSIINVSIDTANHLIVTLSDNSTVDAGLIPTIKGDKGDKGDTGFAPTIKENEDNTEDIYKLDITTGEGTITTPNLKGETTGASTWEDVQNKPFNTLSSDFEVDENNQLKLVVKPTADEIYIGTEEPTDENYKLWINPEENIEGGGSSSISWLDIKEKPFVSISSDFEVGEDGILTVSFSQNNTELVGVIEAIIAKNIETTNIDFSDF